MMFKTTRPKFTLLSATLTLVYGSFISILAAGNSNDELFQQASELQGNQSSVIDIDAASDKSSADNTLRNIDISTIFVRDIIDNCSADMGFISPLKGR
jgi:hypothetical protein